LILESKRERKGSTLENTIRIYISDRSTMSTKAILQGNEDLPPESAKLDEKSDIPSSKIMLQKLWMAYAHAQDCQPCFPTTVWKRDLRKILVDNRVNRKIPNAGSACVSKD
jgi:hypothetical protein